MMAFWSVVTRRTDSLQKVPERTIMTKTTQGKNRIEVPILTNRTTNNRGKVVE